MKTAFVNAKVYVEAGHFEEAVLIEGNRIAKVGRRADILSSGADEVRDCGGKTLIPGFIDTHGHAFSLGLMRSEVPLLGATSIEDIVDRGRKFLWAHPDLKAVHGMGWNYTDFTEGEIRNINRYDLDRISTDIPVIFARACEHMLAANSKALELAGITASTPQVANGRFEIGENGEPNGCFHEAAMDLVKVLLQNPTDDELEEMVRNSLRYMLSLGITTIQSNDIGIDLPTDQILRIYDRIYAPDCEWLFPKIYAPAAFDEPGEFLEFIETAYKIPRHRNFTWGGLKLFKDGSLGAKSALVKEAYIGEPDNYGICVLSPEKAKAFLDIARAGKMRVMTHVIGDKAMADMIESYKPVPEELRWGLNHCQISDMQIIDEMATNHIQAFVQPIFLRSDIAAMQGKIREVTQKTSYAFKTMMKKGINVSFGCDTPVEEPNPFDNIFCAVNRCDFNGRPEGGFYMDESFTVEEAVDCYTVNGAWSQFRENDLGRIKEGYMADMVLLDNDIFTQNVCELRDNRVLMTMVDGKIMYEAQSSRGCVD